MKKIPYSKQQLIDAVTLLMPVYTEVASLHGDKYIIKFAKDGLLDLHMFRLNAGLSERNFGTIPDFGTIPESDLIFAENVIFSMLVDVRMLGYIECIDFK